MKKQVTYIDAAKFESIIVSSGLSVLPQKAFVKISGPKGRNVYLPLTKTIGRCDLSGFTLELEGVRKAEPAPFGSVEQQLDFSRPEAEILSTFASVLEHMKTLPERAIIRKNRTRADSSAVGWSFPIASSTVSSPTS